MMALIILDDTPLASATPAAATTHAKVE
jgi:hypothetical protein